MQHFVKYAQWNWFYTASTEKSSKNSFIRWEKYSQAKCFLDFTNSTSIWRIRYRDKFIYAATAKTYSSNLFCYLLRTLLISGLLSVFFHYSFLKSICKKSKALTKYTRLTQWMPLLNECEKRKHSTKIFHEIIISKLWENRCNWFANS